MPTITVDAEAYEELLDLATIGAVRGIHANAGKEGEAKAKRQFHLVGAEARRLDDVLGRYADVPIDRFPPYEGGK